MGQKSNVNTLRKLTHSNITYNTEKLGLINVSIIKYLRFLFKKKGVLILNYSINKIDNKIYISLDLFFTTKKLNQYRKCKKKLNKKKNFFFKKVLYFLKLNAIFIKVRNMNTVIKKKLLMFFFKNLKKHMKLFEKHRNFFLDFIKITTLFSQNKISTEFFTITIGSLFGLLRKKNHNKFFSFLEFLLGIILNQNSNLIGIKTLFSGRISGKTMASSKIVSQGKVAIQCLNKNIIFQKVHIYTIYGVFGLKLWVHNK